MLQLIDFNLIMVILVILAFYANYQKVYKAIKYIKFVQNVTTKYFSAKLKMLTAAVLHRFSVSKSKGTHFCSSIVSIVTLTL